MFRGKTIQEIAKSGYWTLEEPYDEDDVRRLSTSGRIVTIKSHLGTSLSISLSRSIEELEEELGSWRTICFDRVATTIGA